MCNLLGVEKSNDDARRNYLSSNHHDAPKEVLLTEVRQHTLRMYAREKRRYQKSAKTIGRGIFFPNEDNGSELNDPWGDVSHIK